MNFPAMLDVAIGLFFIYLTLSLLVSGIQELIATVLEWRAKQLKEAIQILLGDTEANDPSAIQAQKIANDLWNHPLIRSLNQRKLLRGSVGPSYISSKMFAATLLEILKTDYDFSPSGKIDDIVESIKENQKLDPEIRRRIYSLALIAQRKARASEKGIKSLEKEIIIWFDQSMERASGVYNRNVKGLAFFIGLVLTILLNADTFHIIERLNKDAALRSSINQVATKIIAENKEPDWDKINPELEKITMPFGWHKIEQVQKPVNSLDVSKSQPGHSAGGNLKIFFGWLLSAAAIAMGAPFWFDLLGKFINVRNAGKVPESTSKDKPS